MHPAKRSFVFVERNVALDPFWTEAVGRGFPLTPASGEESTFVLQPLSLNDERTLQSGLNEPHRVSGKQLAVSSQPLTENDCATVKGLGVPAD